MNVTRESPVAGLKSRFESRDATVGVIGLGYVGLPLACTMVEAGLRVAGFDLDAAKVEKLSRGESYIRHIGAERVRRVISSSASVERLAAGSPPGLVATTDFSDLRYC